MLKEEEVEYLLQKKTLSGVKPKRAFKELLELDNVLEEGLI